MIDERFTQKEIVVVLGAILISAWGIVLGLFFGIRFQLYEPIVIATIIEILFGITFIFYYFKKIFKN